MLLGLYNTFIIVTISNAKNCSNPNYTGILCEKLSLLANQNNCPIRALNQT